MFLAGGNFVLHFRALRGKPLAHFMDEEFKWYLFITLGAIATITFALAVSSAPIISTTGAEVAPTLFESFRYAAFQVVSILTTTGFCTANFALWPSYAALLLVVLMFIGGCGGSTGGGMKVSRFLLLVKYGVAQIRRSLFPREVSNVHLTGRRIGGDTLHKVLGFFFLFVALFVFFALILSCYPGMDFATATSASIASLGNIGPGIGNVGAACTYAWLAPSAKMLLTLAMLLGRLEVYTVLVVILPTFWRR
jgi:trk system potassium uptake protein TrkH